MVYSDKIDIQNFIKENDTLCGNQGSKQDKKKKKQPYLIKYCL